MYYAVKRWIKRAMWYRKHRVESQYASMIVHILLNDSRVTVSRGIGCCYRHELWANGWFLYAHINHLPNIPPKPTWIGVTDGNKAYFRLSYPYESMFLPGSWQETISRLYRNTK